MKKIILATVFSVLLCGVAHSAYIAPIVNDESGESAFGKINQLIEFNNSVTPYSVEIPEKSNDECIPSQEAYDLVNLVGYKCTEADASGNTWKKFALIDWDDQAVIAPVETQLFTDAVFVYDFENDLTDTAGVIGDLTGAVAYSSIDVPQGTAWVTTDNSGYLTVASTTDTNFSVSKSYSFGLWSAQNSSGSTSALLYSDNDGSVNSLLNISFEYNNSVVAGGLRIRHGDSWTPEAWETTYTPTAGVAEHVVVAYDDTTKVCTLYVDNAVYDTHTFTNSIGVLAGDLKILKGYMSADEVVFFGRAITAEEVSTIYNKTWR